MTDSQQAQNFIDCTPEALAYLAAALQMNRNIRVIGTESRDNVCRFILDVSAIYQGPPCQWTAIFNTDKGVSSVTFNPTIATGMA